MQKALPKQPHTLIPDAVSKHQKELTLPKLKRLYHQTSGMQPEKVLSQIVEMICTLKNYMR